MVMKKIIVFVLLLILTTHIICDKCGQEGKKKFRISGGYPTKPHQYPWMVYYAYFKKGGRYICGGSLISDKLVLTSKHCTYKIDSWGTARAGLHNRSEDSNVYQKIEFEKVFLDKTKNDNDIAIILLKEPVDLGDPTLGTVCLPKTDREEYIGESVKGMGWGMVKIRKYEDLLKAVDLEVVNKTKKYFLYTNVQKIEGVYQDPCGGDSGGPLVHKKDYQWTIIGTLIGNGYDCYSGKVRGFGLWTKVTDHLKWIKKIMKKYKDGAKEIGVSEAEFTGWCLTSSGQDQNGGIQMLNNGSKNDCYRQCKTVLEATGCEWDKYGSCAYHTLDVAIGNGNGDHRCWIFNPASTGFHEKGSTLINPPEHRRGNMENDYRNKNGGNNNVKIHEDNFIVNEYVGHNQGNRNKVHKYRNKNVGNSKQKRYVENTLAKIYGDNNQKNVYFSSNFINEKFDKNNGLAFVGNSPVNKFRSNNKINIFSEYNKGNAYLNNYQANRIGGNNYINGHIRKNQKISGNRENAYADNYQLNGYVGNNHINGHIGNNHKNSDKKENAYLDNYKLNGYAHNNHINGHIRKSHENSDIKKMHMRLTTE